MIGKSKRLFFVVLLFLFLTSFLPSCDKSKSRDLGTTSGTAATGAALSNATITFKDKNGQTASTTTDSKGQYSVNTAGLSTPYMVKVDKAGGGSLYSVGYGFGTVNVHPLTDLALYIYYQSLALDPATVFAGLNTSSTTPTQEELNIIKNALMAVLDSWLKSQGIAPQSFDVFNSPFSANGTGFDKILEWANITYNGNAVELKIDNGSLITTASITIDQTNKAFTMNNLTNVPNTSNASGSSFNTLIPTTTELQSALSGATALINQFQNTVNSSGSALADSQILPMTSLSFLDNGLDRSVWPGLMAHQFRGLLINSSRIDRIISYDSGNKILTADVILYISLGTQTQILPLRGVAFKEESGNWLFYGNQRLGLLQVWAETRKESGPTGSQTKKVMFVEVRAPKGTATGVQIKDDAASTNIFGTTNVALIKQSRTERHTINPTAGTSQTLEFDVFVGTKDIASFPTLNTNFTVTLTPSSGPAGVYTLPTQATTTEVTDGTGPNGTTLGNANLGQPNEVNWTTPQTFPIATTELSGRAMSTSYSDVVEPTAKLLASSGTLVFPRSNSGQNITDTQISVLLTGVSGEKTRFLHTYSNTPIITTLSPVEGPIAGGTSVTLNGYNLNFATAVYFGTTQATNLVIGGPNQITFTSPPVVAGLADIKVDTPSGSVTKSGAFTYHPVPILTSVTADSGPSAGGTVVTLGGTYGNFLTTSNTKVTFDTTDVTPSAVGSSSIIATVPAHVKGAVNVKVTTPGGTSGNQTYTYYDTPVITSVTPNYGPSGGGGTITLRGNNFLGSTSMKIGTTTLTTGNFTIVDDTTITFALPAGTAGLVDIEVTNPGGTGKMQNAFTYYGAPTVTAITPNTGTKAGGTPVTITGTNFVIGLTSVTIGGNTVNNLIVTATSLTFNTPPGTQGEKTLVVTTPGGTFTSAAPGGTYTFTYADAPTITGVSPVDGSTNGNDTYTITGTNFLTGTTVQFGSTTAVNATVVSSTVITAVSPITGLVAGPTNITVSTTDGSAVRTNAITLYAPPGVTGINPVAGPSAGNTFVTISGSNFVSGKTTITIDGNNLVSPTVGTTSITGYTPAGIAGARTVSVSTPGGSATTTFTYTNAPVINNLSVTEGSVNGGLSVDINGSFPGATTGNTTVTFGGVSLTPTFADSLKITITTPAHAAGLVDVVVTTPGGSSTLTNGFTYHVVPSITSLNPVSGSAAGGIPLSITGSFGAFATTANTTVIFDAAGTNQSVTPISVTSSTITLNTPAHAQGTVTVQVQTPGGTSGSSNYTFNNSPSITTLNPNQGRSTGGELVRVNGSFPGATTSNTTITFGGINAALVAVEGASPPTWIDVTTPAQSAGQVDVTVTTPGGSFTKVGAFTYLDPPTISTISPNLGKATDTVTISGNFGAFATTINTTVSFGGTGGTVTTVTTNTLLVTVPARALTTALTAVDVVVTTPGGSATQVNGFTYANPPAIASTTPNQGKVTGGEQVVINATVFVSGSPSAFAGATVSNTTVTFGGQAATITGVDTVSSPNTITVTTPPHAAGAVTVTVVTPGGTANLASGFTYVGQPVITSIAPAEGRATGNVAGTNTAVISGSFPTATTTNTTVTFGGVSATVTNVTGTAITVDIPDRTPGQVDIVVTTPGGSATLTGGFIHHASPVLSSVTPTIGKVGDTLTLSGNFGAFATTANTTVTVDATPVTPSSVTSSTIVIAAPAHATGGPAVNVNVTTPGGTSGNQTFDYIAAPTITTILPNEGQIAGAESIVINGTFDGATTTNTTVTFGGVPGNVTGTGATLTVTTPAHSVGNVDIVVTTPGGTATLVNGFLYYGIPTITSITPNTGERGAVASYAVVIKGSNFSATNTTVDLVQGATTRNFTTGGANLVVNDSTTLTATVAAADSNAFTHATPVDVRVNSRGGTVTLTGGITFFNPPTFGTISAAEGPLAGTNFVTITGSNFVAGRTVSHIDGNALVNLTVVNSSTITGNAPSATAAGQKNVTVTTPTGTADLIATGTNAYRYIAAPTITSVVPSDGKASGSEVVVINGSFPDALLANTTVTIGGDNVTPSNVTATSVTFTTPAQNPGTVDVKVTTPGGSFTKGGGYTYLATPSITSVSPNYANEAGGTVIVIRGTGFSMTATKTVVVFDRDSGGLSVPLTQTPVDPTTINITFPNNFAAGDLVDITVQVYGVNSNTIDKAITAYQTPTITGVSPAHGPALGGTSVTITGTNFVPGATSVTVGGQPLGSLNIVDSTKITGVTPAGAAGAANVVVTTLAVGASAPATFTYWDAPTLTGISRPDGPKNGGPAVNITLSGTNLENPAGGAADFSQVQVIFGGVVNVSALGGTATAMTLQPPAHAPGTVDIVVVTPGGTTTLFGSYIYLDNPTFTSVSPAIGEVGQVRSVTLKGTNFSTAPYSLGPPLVGTQLVINDGTTFTTIIPTVVDRNTLTFNMPNTYGTANPMNITITVYDQNVVQNSFFNYKNPPALSISPNVGPEGGGTFVTITDGNSNFLKADPGYVSVTIGGKPLQNLSVVSDSVVTGQVPSGTGIQNVIVQTAAGTDGTPPTFTYYAAPTITAINRPDGPVSGGPTNLTITGTNFSMSGGAPYDFTGVSVTIGGLNAAIQAGSTNTSLVVSVPAHTAGPKDVVVTTPAGSATHSSYTYLAAPLVTSVSPTSGKDNTANNVVISGSNFTSTSISVTFGGVAGTVTSVVDSNTLNVQTPNTIANSTVNVVVTVHGVLSNNDKTFTFKPAPVGLTITPATGPAAGGTFVTITATNSPFVAGEVAVKIGTVPLNNLQVVDANNITGNTPGGSGTVTVEITSSTHVTSTLTYRYLSAPSITSLSRPDGPLTSGAFIDIAGSNFAVNTGAPWSFTGVTATIGGINAVIDTANSTNTSLRVTPPNTAIPGAKEVVVTTPGGSASFSSYTYYGAPTVTSVNPNAGPRSGGTFITIKGTNFTANGSPAVVINPGGTTVAATSVTVVDSTTITANTGDAASAGLANGTYILQVTIYGQNANLANGYTYQDRPVISISPSEGPEAGGTFVTIDRTGGGDFVSGQTTVTIGGKSLANLSVTAAQITGNTPAHTGSQAVTVTTPSGTNTNGVSFNYRALPVISSVTPNTAPASALTGGIILQGSNFISGGTTVRFGGINSPSVTFNSSTQLTVSAPSHSAGVVDIEVITGGGTATLTGGFTFLAVPTITSVTPDKGPQNSNNTVTIQGTNFSVGNTTVTFGGAGPVAASVIDSQTLTAITPNTIAAGPPVNVTVSVQGINSAPAVGAYRFYAAPAGVTISPTSGPKAGGTAITINGSNFYNVSSVTIGGNPVTGLVVVSATKITGLTPSSSVAHNTAVAVNVTNDVGTGSTNFTYYDGPIISSVSPNTAPASALTGGIILQGNNFVSGGTTVRFGGIDSASVTFNSATQLTVQAPSHAAGLVDIEVITSAGTAKLQNGFTFLAAPTISTITPNMGPANTPTAVVIKGTNFSVGNTTVTFGATVVAAGNVTVVDSMTLNLNTPSTIGAGPVGVFVTVQGVNSNTLVNGYRFYSAPSGIAISPISGPTAGGTSVTITGASFYNVSGVTIDGNPVTGLNVVNTTTITAITPAGATGAARDVVVTNDAGSGTGVGLFTYYDPPIITSITPNGGPAGVATNGIVMVGNNFVNGATTVTFGATNSGSVTFNSATQLTVQAPAQAAGVVDVSVTTGAGTATKTNSFTYYGTPTITSINPNRGKLAGGTSVTIKGTNFLSGTTNITIDGNNLANLVVVDDKTITGDTPVGASAGAKNVVVSNTTLINTVVGGFTYYGDPTVTSITPTAGPKAGGQVVTIGGTNFEGVSSVTIGGNGATNVSVVSSTQITATTPSSTVASGTVVAVVVTTDQAASIPLNGYTYFGAPTITNISPTGQPLAGGGVITITGTGFNTPGDTTVYVGGKSVTPSSITLGGTNLTFTAPTHTAGPKDITIIAPGGSVTYPAGLSYFAAPTITSITPAWGPAAGATFVTIKGSNFDTFPTSTTATVGGKLLTSPTVVDNNTITGFTQNFVIVSGDSQATDVVVISTGGSNTLVNGFTYFAAPVVTSVTPNEGPLTGGTSITIVGTGFMPSTTVIINGKPLLNPVIVGTTGITGLIPNSGLTSPGGQNYSQQYPVSVSTTAGTDSSQRFVYMAAPEIVAVTAPVPAEGPTAGGTQLTITGYNFSTTAGATSATLGGNNMIITNITPAPYPPTPAIPGSPAGVLTMTATAPAGAPGPVPLAITSSGGTGNLANAYTYRAAPTISFIRTTADSISPAEGPVSTATNITIFGTNFFNVSLVDGVQVGGINCANIVVVSSTQITADVPTIATAGPYPVQVTATGGTVVFADGYTYFNAPVISSVTPNYGWYNEPTPVTIRGANYSTTAGKTNASITDGGPVNLTGQIVVDIITITGNVPGRADPGNPLARDVNVTSAGAGTATRVNGFTYYSDPTIAGVSGADGSLAGGNVLTINGTNFLNANTAVTVGGNPATAVNLLSTTQLTCAVPAGAGAGQVNIVVTTTFSTGTQRSVTLVNGYTYWAAPTISGLSRDNGLSTGGPVLTINGTNLAKVLPGPWYDFSLVKVYFGGTQVSVALGGTNLAMTATPPARAAGLVDIVVTTPGGSATLQNSYTYLAPTITNISPASGTVNGGQSVTITGTDFSTTGGTTNVWLVEAGVPIAAAFTVVNSTTITATTPNFVLGTGAGTYNARVRVYGTDFNGGTYTVVDNTNIAIAPASGPTAGGTGVTITDTAGRNSFVAGQTTVTIGGSNLANLSVVNSNTITGNTPAGAAGAASVVVTTNGITDPGPPNFTYRDAPVITNISPTEISAGALAAISPAQVLTITGLNLSDAGGAPTFANVKVYIGGELATIDTIVGQSSDTSLQLIAIPAAASAGAKDVRVETPGGVITIVGGVTRYAAPTVTSVTPAQGPEAGGTTITIYGTGFVVGNTAGVIETNAGASSTALVIVNVDSSTQISATIPVRPGGLAAGVAHRIEVNTLGGALTSAGLNSAFTYNAVPTITVLNPTSGSSNGGTLVTITGTNFVSGGTSVTLGGNTVTSYYINAATVQFITPPGLVGAFPVVVTTSGGSSNSQDFTYTSGPAAFTQGPNPVSGSTSQSLTPTLQWTDTTDETGYTVEVATDVGFVAIIYSINLVANTVSHTLPSGVLSNNTVYYWRIRATDATTSTTASNAPFNFRTALLDQENFNFPNGFVNYDNQGTDIFNDVIVDGDKYIAVGYSNQAGDDDAVIASFSSSGALLWYRTYGFGQQEVLMGIAKDTALNKYVTVGYINSAPPQWVFARFNLDGSLDTTFNAYGTSGWIQYDGVGARPNVTGIGYRVVVDGSGRYIAAGKDNDGAADDGRVVRVDNTGLLDATFKGSGIVTLNYGGDDNYSDIGVDSSNGHIFVCGYGSTVGSITQSLDDAGVSVNDILVAGIGWNGLTIDGNNRVVVSGGNGADFTVMRYTTIFGTLAADGGFNGGSIQVINILGTDVATDVKIDGSGRIVVTGISNNDMFAARLTSAGALDGTFNGTGYFVHAPTGGNDGGLALAIDGSGRIIVVGFGGGSTVQVIWRLKP